MGDSEMYEEVEKRRKERKEEDDLEERITLMKRMSKKRIMEETGTKPRKRARIEVDWRELRPGTELGRGEGEIGGQASDEGEEVSEKNSEVDEAEELIEELLKILESERVLLQKICTNITERLEY